MLRTGLAMHEDAFCMCVVSGIYCRLCSLIGVPGNSLCERKRAKCPDGVDHCVAEVSYFSDDPEL